MTSPFPTWRGAFHYAWTLARVTQRRYRVYRIEEGAWTWTQIGS